MWTAVYMSKNMDDIERLRVMLRDSSVISMVRRNDDFFEILVPSQEVSAAHRIIIDAEI